MSVLGQDPGLEPCDDPAGHDWREGSAYCESCGGWEHAAVYCNNCCESVDLVWYDDPRNT